MAATRTAAPAVVCDRVSRHFGIDGDIVIALDDVSVRIEAGELAAVVGPSGSGKSTLLGMIGCVDRPTSGTVTIRGVEVTGLGRGDRRGIRRHVAATMLSAPADNLLLDRTGSHNIMVAARQRGSTGADIGGLERRLGIDRFASQVAGRMSGDRKTHV